MESAHKKQNICWFFWWLGDRVQCRRRPWGGSLFYTVSCIGWYVRTYYKISIFFLFFFFFTVLKKLFCATGWKSFLSPQTEKNTQKKKRLFFSENPIFHDQNLFFVKTFFVLKNGGFRKKKVAFFVCVFSVWGGGIKKNFRLLYFNWAIYDFVYGKYVRPIKAYQYPNPMKMQLGKKDYDITSLLVPQF